MTDNDQWLSDRQVIEEMLHGHFSQSALARWRRDSSGPPYLKFDGKIFYRRADVEHWIREQVERRQGVTVKRVTA